MGLRAFFFKSKRERDPHAATCRSASRATVPEKVVEVGGGKRKKMKEKEKKQENENKENKNKNKRKNKRHQFYA